MKVSFHSIPLKGTGWESIIEPKEFDAFVCKGKCNKRSKSILNTHALLQNRLRRVKKSEIPRLCCTSKKRKPLVVKVVDSHFQRRQGKLDDMIVTECGCG
ncbi:nodal homolog [Tachypleus tridentatus]|uniref:nodal homolog n=1 Tax=Tachypleus tridentatus TaxID=6853 RepID=UPI003FCF304A